MTESEAPVSELTALAERLVEETCELVVARAAIARRPDNVLGLLLRDLTKEEIAVLEHNGCRAEGWQQIRVAQDFDPFRVQRCFFAGPCVLGRFAGTREIQPGLSLPCGIYDSTLSHCQIGNDCLIEKVRFCSNSLIDHGAVLFDIGSFICTGDCAFGCDQRLTLAIETGGREVPLWANMTIPAAYAILRDRHDRAGLDAIDAAHARYIETIRSPLAWVRRGARVLHIDRVANVYIGPGAQVDDALELRNLAVLSKRDEVTRITSGALVCDSLLQWGVAISGNAIVRQAALLEHSGADLHACVEDSVIGPNTHIGKGEVTASLVGPFVGFHHQSMLIAACWPQGKGNIAYGAMVGSNHTGRAPDQEMWAGEGIFFGLGCSIRYPTNFVDAPYTVISAGVNTLPQCMCFPFSLLTTPSEPAADQPRAFNELMPGWALSEGAYGLVRSELKFKKRDHSRRHEIPYQVLRPEIMRLVEEALARLETIRIVKEIYNEQDIPGIGKNFLRESARQAGIAAYSLALERYALRVLLADAEGHEQLPGSVEVARQLMQRFLPEADLRAQMQRLHDIEHRMAEVVQRSKARDLERGQRIIPGYEHAHDDGPDDPVVADAWRRVQSTRERIDALLA